MPLFVFIIMLNVVLAGFYQFAYGYIGESTETALGEKIGINADGQEYVLTNKEYRKNVEVCSEMKQSGYLEIDKDNYTNTADIDCNDYILKKEGFLKIIEYLRSGLSS